MKVRVACGVYRGSLDGECEGIGVQVDREVVDDTEVREAEVRNRGDQFVLTRVRGLASVFTGRSELPAAHLEVSPRKGFGGAPQLVGDFEVGEEDEMCQRVYALAREQTV